MSDVKKTALKHIFFVLIVFAASIILLSSKAYSFDQNQTQYPSELSDLERSYLQIHTIKLSSSEDLRYGFYGADLSYYFEKQLPYPESIILFLPGRGGWVEQYIDVFEALYSALKIPIVVVDHLGQGQSGGVRAHIEHYNQYADSFVEVLYHLFEKTQPQINIIAHSAGGLMALHATISKKIDAKKIVMTGPMLRMRSNPLPGYLAHPISFLASIAGHSLSRPSIESEAEYNFENNRLSTDRERYNILANHPYPIPSPSFGWLNASYSAQNFIHTAKNLYDFDSDVLVFYGSEEKVVSADGIKSWVHQAIKHSKSQDISIIKVLGAKHDLFYEKQEIVDDILSRIIGFLSVDY